MPPVPMETPEDAGSGGILTIDLDPQRVQPGASEVMVTIEPPDGHVFNPSVPFELHAKSLGTAVDPDPEAVRLVALDPLFPHVIPARFHHGQDRIDLDIVAYFCDEDEPRLCYYQHVRLNLPVEVHELADATRVIVTYRLGVPDVGIS